MATSFFFWEDLFGTFNVVGALMFLWGVCNLPLKGLLLGLSPCCSTISVRFARTIGVDTTATALKMLLLL